jgi:hypothetical protein
LAKSDRWQRLVERGLMWLDTSHRLPRLLFTEAGFAELRAMMTAAASPIRRNTPMFARNSASIPYRKRRLRARDGKVALHPQPPSLRAKPLKNCDRSLTLLRPVSA